jgi:lactoylglutathione lyase
MITGIRSVNIKVRDQRRARAFWADQVGLGVVSDVPMPDFPGKSWLEMAPGGSDTIMVMQWPVFAEVEYFSGITLLCDDVRATHAELSGKGVEFVTAPVAAKFGWWATFRDVDGNVYVLREEPAGTFTPEPEEAQ